MKISYQSLSAWKIHCLQATFPIHPIPSSEIHNYTAAWSYGKENVFPTALAEQVRKESLLAQTDSGQWSVPHKEKFTRVPNFIHMKYVLYCRSSEIKDQGFFLFCFKY